LSQPIRTIKMALPIRLGSVNCYLLEAGTRYVLVDTGCKNQRAFLEQELLRVGCEPGKLSLIVLTHGDFDHTGNAAYLHERYGAPIGIHAGDREMLTEGEMYANRKRSSLIVKAIARALYGFGKAEQVSPDVALEAGMDLGQWGLDAEVVSIPGHSMGSIGILTATGDLLAGDLLENMKQPQLGSRIDDDAAAAASIERLKGKGVRNVYPGHGQPFEMKELLARIGSEGAPVC